LGRRVILEPVRGRAYAASHSDFMLAAEEFANPGWKLRRVNEYDEARHAASISLESFLLRAAFAGKESLPPFPDGRYRLETWPDLGTLPSLLSVLRMAQCLVAGAVSPTDLAQR